MNYSTFNEAFLESLSSMIDYKIIDTSKTPARIWSAAEIERELAEEISGRTIASCHNIFHTTTAFYAPKTLTLTDAQARRFRDTGELPD